MLISDIEITLKGGVLGITEHRKGQNNFSLLSLVAAHSWNGALFCQKNLDMCILKNLEPWLMKKCPVLTLPASLRQHSPSCLYKSLLLRLCLSSPSILFAQGRFHFLLYHEAAAEPICPEPFCHLHFSCPLLCLVSILKCLCNNFGPAGVFWSLKILIRRSWVPAFCLVENLLSSPRFLLIARSLTRVSGTPVPPTSHCDESCFSFCPCAYSLSLLQLYLSCGTLDLCLICIFCFEWAN